MKEKSFPDTAVSRRRKSLLYLKMSVFLLLGFTLSLSATEIDVKTDGQSESLQQITVEGIVTDAQGNPLAGVTVLVKGTTVGTITDIAGKYSVRPESGQATLVFSFVGMTTQEIPLNNRTKLDVILEEDVARLDEVIVVGYTVGNKRSISGAIENLSQKDMNAGYTASPIDAIKGKVAGLMISTNGGNVNETPRIRLRGLNSLSGGNDPLVIIDGVYGDIRMLNSMSQQDIEEITILKDASETAQYGSRGAAGVIIATTKKGKSGTGNISYSGQFGYSHAYKNIQVLSAEEWRDLNVNKFGSAGNDKGASTDWLDWIQRDVVTQNNHTITFTQGTAKSNMLASVGINSKLGQLKKGDNTTYSIRFNGSQTGLNDRLKLELNIMAFSTKQNNPIGGIWTSALNYNPTFPSHRNTETGMWDFDPNASMATHPGEASEIINYSDTKTIMPSGRATFTIIKGLTLSGFGSLNKRYSSTKSFTPNDHYQQQSGGRGNTSVSNSDGNDWLGNVQLQYVKDFGNIH